MWVVVLEGWNADYSSAFLQDTEKQAANDQIPEIRYLGHVEHTAMTSG